MYGRAAACLEIGTRSLRTGSESLGLLARTCAEVKQKQAAHKYAFGDLADKSRGNWKQGLQSGKHGGT